MDAFFARNRLSAYLDGDLPSGEAREIESALANDPALRAEFEALRSAVDLLRAEGIVEPPVGFAERVRAAVANEPMPSRWRRWTRHVRVEAVLLAAAALLVVTWVGNKPAPEEAPVVAAPDAPPPAPAAPASSAPDPLELAGRNESMAKARPSPKADAILGNEVKKQAPGKQSMVQKGAESAVEVEPYQADWEKTDDEPQAQAAADGPMLHSPAPFRYRLDASDERVLLQLQQIASSLGGELQDGSGRKLAPYMMNEGDLRTVRVVVPTYNEAALARKLRELGEVETITTRDATLLKPGEEVPVQVEVSY